MSRFGFAIAVLPLAAVLTVRGDDPEPVPGDFVTGVTYSPDGKWLVVAQRDNFGGPERKHREDRVTVYDSTTLKAVRTYSAPEHVCRPVNFSPDGKTVYCAGKDGAIYAIDFDTWQVKKKEPADSWYSVRVGVSPGGKWLVSYHYEARTKHPRLGQSRCAVWEAVNLKHVRDFPAGPNLAGSFAFAPDRKTVAIAYRAKDDAPVQQAGVIEYDLDSGREVRRCVAPNIALDARPVLGPLAYSPDGNRLFISGGDAVPVRPGAIHCTGYLRVWDRATGKVTPLPPRCPNDYLCALTFSPDGKRLYVGSGGYLGRSDARGARWLASRVECWDTANWTELWSTDAEHSRVHHLHLSPAGDRVLAADDGGLWLFDAKTGAARGGLLRSRWD